VTLLFSQLENKNGFQNPFRLIKHLSQPWRFLTGKAERSAGYRGSRDFEQPIRRAAEWLGREST
jgi:hypothetical protein